MESHKLHLGSGKDYREGWVKVEHPSSRGVLKADVYQDLNKKEWVEIAAFCIGNMFSKYQPPKFDHVEMHHVLEHLDDPTNALENIWHLCKPGAKVIISVPHWSNPMSWGDLTHKRVCSSFSMLYYELGYPEYYTPNAKFKVVGKKFTITRNNHRWTKAFDWILNISPVFTEYVFARFVPISQVVFELEAIK